MPCTSKARAAQIRLCNADMALNGFGSPGNFLLRTIQKRIKAEKGGNLPSGGFCRAPAIMRRCRRTQPIRKSRERERTSGSVRESWQSNSSLPSSPTPSADPSHWLRCARWDGAAHCDLHNREGVRQPVHRILQLRRRTCTTLLAHAKDAASDCDVNIVHTSHNYMAALMIVSKHAQFRISDLVKWGLTNNRINTVTESFLKYCI